MYFLVNSSVSHRQYRIFITLAYFHYTDLTNNLLLSKHYRFSKNLLGFLNTLKIYAIPLKCSRNLDGYRNKSYP